MIWALSSGAGRAAIAVVRISGHGTGALLKNLTGKDLASKPRRLIRCPLLASSSEDIVDDILAVYFKEGSSYTGEESGELHLHASPAVLNATSRLLSSHGVRMAEPGEFTRRALANGRMRLDQAEALADLLASRTEAQRRLALRGMLGSVLHARVVEWQEAILHARARLEAWIDFAEEDVSIGDLQSLDPLVRSLEDQLQRDKRASELIRTGLTIVIAGPPNAGKSSLLNKLAGRKAALVSPIPGTTRDLVQVEMELAGLPVRFIDTAGLRESSCELELGGMELARDAMGSADLVLWLDSQGLIEKEAALVEEARLIRVQSKADLTDSSSSWKVSTVSEAIFTDFLAKLTDRIQSDKEEPSSLLLTSERHYACVQQALHALEQAKKLEPIQAAEQLRRAASSLARITSSGSDDSERVLDALFSTFCIGK